LGLDWHHDYQIRSGIKPQYIDFYLPAYSLAIEFDGQQHWEENSFFGASLEETKLLDNRKERFLEANDIRLVRIRYGDRITSSIVLKLIMGEE